MSTNRVSRTLMCLLIVWLLVVLTGGSALVNHPLPAALAQSSGDVLGSPAVLADAHPGVITSAPAANFLGDPTRGLPPLEVQFTDEST